MEYNLYYYDSTLDAVVMKDKDDNKLVIECAKANAQVVFDELEVVDITKSNKIEPSNDITGVSITVNDIKVNIDENFNQKTLFDVLRIVKMI